MGHPAKYSNVTVKGVKTSFLFWMESCLGKLSSSQLDLSHGNEIFLLSSSDAAKVKTFCFSSHGTKCDASDQIYTLNMGNFCYLFLA